MDFTANHLICRSASDHGFAGKLLATTGAVTWRGGMVFDDTLNKTLHQRALAALAVFKDGGFTLQAGNLHCAYGPFFARLGHIS